MRWRTVTFGTVSKLVNGRAFSTTDWSPSGVPIIRIQNLNGDKPFNYWAGPLDRQVCVDTNDMLLAWSGTPGTSFGAHIWRGPKSVLNQHIFRVDLDERQITKEWAVLIVNYRLNRLIDLAHGGVGLKHVTRGTVEGLELLLPPLSEQRRIAAILDTAEALREKRCQAIAKLDSLSQSVFLEIFGDPIRSGSNFERLSECAEVASGVTKGRRLNGRKTVELPYLRVANVQAGYLDLKEIKTITALPSDLESLSLQDGDILLTEGGDHDKLGRGARWRGGIENCIHQNHVFRVRVNRNRILPEFLEAYLQTSFSRDYFLRCAKKTTNLASINMTQLRALPVMLPPMHLQFECRSAFQIIESLKERQNSWLAKHQSLLTSLQHRAFRGEL